MKQNIKQLVSKQLLGQLGIESSTYKVYETYGPDDKFPRKICVCAIAYGSELSYLELDKYSVVVVTAYQVTKDELNLYGKDYKFEHEVI
jgi:hypothetical protein